MDLFDGTIAVWGDDTGTIEVDGAESFSQVSLQLVNSNILYQISTEEIIYTTNSIQVLDYAFYTIVDCNNDMGCMDSLELNFDPYAEFDDNSCYYQVYGCMDPLAFNFNQFATVNLESVSNQVNPCIEVVEGCTNENAFNFDSLANTDNGSCIPVVLGCIDNQSFNFIFSF